MDPDDRERIYKEIEDRLGLDRRADEMARDLLASLLESNSSLYSPDRTFKKIEGLVKGRTCIVFGGGPSLEAAVDQIMKGGDLYQEGDGKRPTLIAADGAASVLIGRGIRPDVIVTDLDGGTEDQIMCSGRGTVMLVHGHGDNMESLKKVVPRLVGWVIGSTQVNPGENGFMVNFGGFTDGDRAVVLCDHLDAERTILAGFDLQRPAEKITDGGRRIPLRPDESKEKMKKLEVAEMILDELNERRLEHLH